MTAATPPRPFVAFSPAELTAPPSPSGPRERYPWDLAVEVARQLEPSRGPRAEQLGALFEVLYFASLRTEESEPVLCSVCWLDPELALPPAPTVPGPRLQRTAKARPPTARVDLPCDGRTVVRFGQGVALSIATLIKLSAAADPDASSLAVFPDATGRLVAWGMIDQIRRDDPEAARLGVFEATIAAPAHIVVTSHGRAVASLIHGQLTRRFHDVFRKGPIHRALDPFVSRFTGRVRAAVGKEVFEQAGDHWEAALRRLWLGTLGRILVSVAAYRHGGALLLAPRLDAGCLRVKYALRYARLQDALVRLAVTRVERAHARDRLWRGYLLDQDDGRDVPAELHIEEGRSSSAEAQSVSEVSGCVRFVASLTRVDGLVAMDGDMAVHGFGAEITAQGDPPEVVVATDAAAENTDAIDPTHFGTRHRSMMRYCVAQPGSVGLVVSQDGAIRALTSHNGGIVLWEQIELVEPEASSDPGDSTA